MDNNRPGPLFAEGEEIIRLPSKTLEKVISIHWIDKGEIRGFSDGMERAIQCEGYCYETTFNPGYGDHEGHFAKKPDIGTFEGTFFNPHEVKVTA